LTTVIKTAFIYIFYIHRGVKTVFKYIFHVCCCQNSIVKDVVKITTLYLFLFYL